MSKVIILGNFGLKNAPRCELNCVHYPQSTEDQYIGDNAVRGHSKTTWINMGGEGFMKCLHYLISVIK